jgi:tetratricopeptide (TPR) repeat protein
VKRQSWQFALPGRFIMTDILPASLRGLLWLFLIVIGPLSAPGQEGRLPAAPVRLRIERNSDSPWPATVGVAETAPCLGKPAGFGVFTGDGKPVAFKTIWFAAGEATRLLFDTSGGAERYYLCFGASLPEAPEGWNPEAGVIEQTRPCGEQPADTAAQVARLLQSAGPPFGCGEVPDIFSGVNPFGPFTYYVADFTGWFRVFRGGVYVFATASDDASYLQVDGRTVAQWLGRHGAGEGRRGEHSGALQLQSGVHRIDYVQIQFDGASAAVAAWKPPGSDRFEVMPPSAFLPIAHFHAANLELAPSQPEQVYFEWQTEDHCAIGASITVRVRFRALDAHAARAFHWHFDDGSDAEGASVRHFFPEPGLRRVTVEAWDRRACVATNSALVRVAPHWRQIDWWRDDVFDEAKRDFLHRDLARMPARDLGAIIDLGDRADDRELFLGAGEAMLKRQDEFNTTASAPTFYNLGLGFEHQGDWGDGLAEKAWRADLNPHRSIAALDDKVKLRLADLLIHSSGDLEEAAQLLAGISGLGLSADERRLWKLAQIDILLARGQTDNARARYAAASEAPAKTSARFDIARAGQLESASLSVERGDFDAAQRALDQFTFANPLERMSVDTGLVRLRLCLGRKEFQRAFTTARLLLPMSQGDPRRSELLYDLAEAGYALGRTNQARPVVLELLKNFPYSESAAKAKDKWGRQ